MQPVQHKEQGMFLGNISKQLCKRIRKLRKLIFRLYHYHILCSLALACKDIGFQRRTCKIIHICRFQKLIHRNIIIESEIDLLYPA